MSLSVSTILGSLANLISKNNTTTSSNDISSGLTKRVTTIYKGCSGMNEVFPVPASIYPVVFVEVIEKTEEFSQLGKSSRRDASLFFSVVPMVHYVTGKADVREYSNMEVIKLTQNIENLLRNYITLSTTVNWCNIKSTTFSVQNGESFFNSISRINLEVNKLT